MQGDQLVRLAQRLIRMLRPENFGTAAQTAMTWLKAAPSSLWHHQADPKFPD
jgi:hypothetical protein